jgi:hypothetical protein
METNIKTTKSGLTIPVQCFNGKDYKLYKDERYFSRGTKRLHTEVWKYYKGEIPKGYDIHHIDNNTYNNEISNLNLVYKTLHKRFTGKQRFKNNPEWFKDFHAKGIEKAKEWHKSAEGLQWHSEHGKACWNKREYFLRNCTVCEKEYKTPFPDRSKYCHQNCKAKALRIRRKLSSSSL